MPRNTFNPSGAPGSKVAAPAFDPSVEASVTLALFMCRNVEKGFNPKGLLGLKAFPSVHSAIAEASPKSLSCMEMVDGHILGDVVIGAWKQEVRAKAATTIE